MCKDCELAWAAGLYEGEGCTRFNGTTAVMKLAMVDRDIVEAFHRVVVAGKIYGPYKRSTQVQHEWVLNGWDRVASLYEQLKPWLGRRRREQAETVLSMRYRTIKPAHDCNRYTVPLPSTSGYYHHRQNGEKACAMCLKSLALYQQVRRDKMK